MEKEHKSKGKIHKIKKAAPKHEEHHAEEPAAEEVVKQHIHHEEHHHHDKHHEHTPEPEAEHQHEPIIEEIHTEKTIEEKTTHIPPNDKDDRIETLTVKTETKTKIKRKHSHKSMRPIYVLLIGILLVAFGIGGISAKFGFNKHNNDAKTDDVKESTESAEQKKNETDKIDSISVLKTKPPEISAKSYGIYTLKDGDYKELTSKNPDTVLPLASVTKVMTAIIAIERYDMDKTITIPAKCVGLNASSVGFRPNEVFTMQDIMYGLLVKSGADAACAIANIDNEADFIAQMNYKAAALGMKNTKFTNAIGLDNSDAHVSDVNDIKLLVTHALKYSEFRKIVGTGEITITSKSSKASYHVRNTNDLLFSIPGTVGIKTGLTDGAGECLTYLYQSKDQEILIVILGSHDRFGDTTKLLNWAKGELAPEKKPEPSPSATPASSPTSTPTAEPATTPNPLITPSPTPTATRPTEESVGIKKGTGEN